MIEITTGLILTGAGVLGILVCAVMLLITGPVFKRQRRKLLNRIEEE